LTGKLDEDSIAGISGGKISFDLLTAQGTLVTVFAPSSLEDEEMLILNTPEGGNQTLTVKSAAKKINELTGATIRAEGKSAPTAAGFSADVSLTITKKAATSATLSGFATTTASLNSAGGVDFTLEDENGEEFSVTVASTATVTYHRNSGTDSFTGDLESLEVLIDGGDDGFIELGGTLSGSSFTASICTVYQAPEDTTGGDSGGAIIAGALVGAVTDFQFTVDFYDWTTGDAENVTVTVPNVSGITYIIYDEDAVATTATRAQALAALQDNPAFVEAMGSESYTSGDGEYSADLGVTIVAESGQFGANAYFGTLASGSVATVVNGDVVFDLLVEDEFGSTTIEVTIDVSEATVTFYDSFFNDEVITAAQTIANRINNDADGIFVSSLSGQSGETFTADDVVELYEASTGGGDFGILTGVMKSGTTASGSSGNLVFTMSVNLPDGSTTDVAVTVSSSAYFELFDMSGPSTVTPTAMADALNANPTTHYTFVQGSIPYNGEATYFADTYISTSIFGQSTFLFGIPASAATVNGNDVEFDLDTYDEIGNPITVVVTIDTTLATVTHRDENFIETTLTTAQDVADYINDETMEMFLESSSVQSGGTFLADVTVDLYGASTGGGGGGAFIDGHMTPDTTASAATGDLVFSFDTLDPMSGSDLTVTVTVASSAQFDIIDFDGTPYFDVGAQAMADEMNANGDLSAIFVYGSLEWNGETAYFADGGMTLSLIGGTGGAFVYWGTVDTSTNAPMFDGNNIIFDLEVFEGAFEGPVTPQVVTVTASPLAFIQSFTTANGFQPETDGNTIAGLLDAMPFEVEVALTAQLDVGTSAYTLDAGGHMFIFVDDPSGGGGGGGGGGVTVDLDAYELVEGGGFFTLVVSGGMAPYTISQVSNVMINGYVTDFPSIGLTENSPNDLDISDDDSALVAGDVVTFDVVIQDANMDTSASTPITLNIISAGGGGITVDVDSYDLVEGGGIFGLLVSGGMGPYTISQVSNVVHSTLGPTTFAALGLTENAPGDLEIADDGMTLVAGDVVTFDVVIEDANMDTSASTPITLNIISAGGGGINVDILTYDLTAGGNMISLMVSGGTGPYTIQSVTNVMLNGNPTDFATIGLTENSPAGLDISDSGATLVAGDVVMFDVVIEDSTTATSAPFTIIVTVVP
ncbi:MAG: hypothetical protein HUU29_10680, partial [Planctomycetaceae bacterium]|nr:hypothetical protein [Planctomycetaceae bacterium]